MQTSLALVVAALCAAAPAQRASRIKIAVLEIRAVGADEKAAELLSEVALTEAAADRSLDVIGRSDVAALLGFEKQKQVLGCAEDSSCIAEIGGALGVDFMLVGTLGRIGDLHRIDLRLIEVRKARVSGRWGESVEGRSERLVAAVQRGTRSLLGVFSASRGAPASAAARPAPGRRAAWIVGGAGAALLAAGGLMGLSARSAYDDLKTASAAGDPAAYDDARSALRTRSVAADVLMVAGAAGLGTGGWLWWRSRPATVAFVPVDGGGMIAVQGRLP